MPPMMPSLVLNRLRAETLKLLPDQCTILRLARTGNATDGFREDWMPFATVACRLDSMGATAGEARELNVGVEPHKLIVAWDAPLTTNSRIRHGDYVYEIRKLRDDATPLIIIEADVLRVNQP